MIFRSKRSSCERELRKFGPSGYVPKERLEGNMEAKIIDLDKFIVCLKQGYDLTGEERKELAEYLEWWRNEERRKAKKIRDIKNP